jgi:hypothetical protein
MRITKIQELQEYFVGVKRRAEHHAQDVEEVIYPLLVMIIAYMDNGTDIEVRGTQGSTGNLLWAFINGKRYAFRYEHTPVSIEIREKTYKGTLRNTITNKTTFLSIKTSPTLSPVVAAIRHNSYFFILICFSVKFSNSFFDLVGVQI